MSLFTGLPIPVHFPSQTITATTTTLDGDLGVIEANPSAPATWTLCSLAPVVEGSFLWIKNISANNITLNAHSGNTINGGGSTSLGAGYNIWLLADGTLNWRIMSYIPNIVVGGPGLSTDNALVRWDGTSGALVQNSNAILDDAGSLSLVLNLSVGGTLGVTGAATLSSTLAVSGNTTVGGTLGVTGAATLSSTLAVSGNTTVGGTLGVTGATTLGSTLGVTGAATFDNTVNISDITKNYQINSLNAIKFDTSNLYVGPTGTSSGLNNVFVGVGAAAAATSAAGNTVVGKGAGAALTTGADNAFYGRNAGSLVDAGASNSFFGVGAGASAVGGSNNTCVGLGADVVAGASFRTAIGSNAVCTADSTVQLGRAGSDDTCVGRNLKVPNGTIGSASSQVKFNAGTYTQLTSPTTAVPVTTNVGTITMQAALTTAAGAKSATFNVDFSGLSQTGQTFSIQVTGYTGTWDTNGIPLALVESISANVATVSVFNAHSSNALNGIVTFTYRAL